LKPSPEDALEGTRGELGASWDFMQRILHWSTNAVIRVPGLSKRKIREGKVAPLSGGWGPRPSFDKKREGESVGKGKSYPSGLLNGWSGPLDPGESC